MSQASKHKRIAIQRFRAFHLSTICKCGEKIPKSNKHHFECQKCWTLRRQKKAERRYGKFCDIPGAIIPLTESQKEEIYHYKKTKIARCSICQTKFIEQEDGSLKINCEHNKGLIIKTSK